MIRFKIFSLFLSFPSSSPFLFILSLFSHLSSAVATAEDSCSLARIMTSTRIFLPFFFYPSLPSSLSFSLSKVCIPHTLVTLISTKFTGGTS